MQWHFENGSLTARIKSEPSTSLRTVTYQDKNCSWHKAVGDMHVKVEKVNVCLNCIVLRSGLYVEFCLCVALLIVLYAFFQKILVVFMQPGFAFELGELAICLHTPFFVINHRI